MLRQVGNAEEIDSESRVGDFSFSFAYLVGGPFVPRPSNPAAEMLIFYVSRLSSGEGEVKNEAIFSHSLAGSKSTLTFP